MKNLMLLFFICVSFKCLSQNNTELLSTVKVLAQLSEAAQREGDKSSVLIYQNTFYQIWEANVNLHGSDTFQKAFQFFDTVKKNNHSAIKEQCFSLNGKLPKGSEGLPNIVVVDTPSDGWANNEIPSLLIENFDKGLISSSDIEYFTSLRAINEPRNNEQDYLKKNKILQDAILLRDKQIRLDSNLKKSELKPYDKLIKSIEEIEKSAIELNHLNP